MLRHCFLSTPLLPDAVHATTWTAGMTYVTPPYKQQLAVVSRAVVASVAIQVKVYELRKTVLEIVELVLFIFSTPPPPENRGMLTLSHYHNLS